jgi:DNA-binding MarR family transcriptional regulator
MAAGGTTPRSVQYLVARYNHRMLRARHRRRHAVVDYATLAELRYRIRQFLRLREVAARAAGVEPQQYQLLLQLKGLESHRPVTVGVLAERLQVRHHSVVELVDRLARRGMVGRRRDRRDRRGVVVGLRAKGQTVLRRLALHSLAELETEGPALVSVLARLIGRPRCSRRAPRRRRAEEVGVTSPVRRSDGR